MAQKVRWGKRSTKDLSKKNEKMAKTVSPRMVKSEQKTFRSKL